MSEILQLSFISSKSRHLSALCVSEIMLGSLANNCDREGAKSHRGGTLIHTGSFKVRSGLLHNQLRPSDESTEHMQGPCILLVLTELIINDDIDHVNCKNGQQSVSLDQMFNNSNLWISNKIIWLLYLILLILIDLPQPRTVYTAITRANLLYTWDDETSQLHFNY